MCPCFQYVNRRVITTWAPAGFFQGWANYGPWGRKSSSAIQGWSPGAGLGTKLPEADDML